MKNIINLNDVKKYEGFDKHVSAILSINNIPENDLKDCFPDKIGKRNFTSFEDYFNSMERIDGTDEFIKFVKENKNEKSIVISDHDCDGIMACVICAIGLNEYGVDIQYLSTDRFKTGYGMKKSSIDEAIKSGAKVIYTVDQGITCNEVIDYAKSKGLKVCVTDHHIGKEVSHADAVVDPCYFLNNTKFKEISGATVIFKLIYELFKSEGYDTKFLYDLAALAGITVLSDCMEMLNENRILYKCTMNYCNSQVKKNTFIKRLADLLCFYLPGADQEFCQFIPTRNFNSTQVNFYFIPLINAVNRIEGNVTCLINDIVYIYYNDIEPDGSFYQRLNNYRKTMKSSLTKMHRYNVNESVCVEAFDTGILENYSGICGLVASDVVENEKKPALIGTIDSTNIVKFSGRSVQGYSLYNLLKRIKEDHPELNLNFGGHDQALGCSIPKNNIDAFREIICEYYTKDAFEITETYLPLDDGSVWKRVYKIFAPFGSGFIMPQFYVETSISYFDSEKRTFKLSDCGKESIVCYNYVDVEYMKYLAYKKKHEEKIQAILEFVYDPHGELVLKLVNILNKNPEIERQILEERNNSIG